MVDAKHLKDLATSNMHVLCISILIYFTFLGMLTKKPLVMSSFSLTSSDPIFSVTTQLIAVAMMILPHNGAYRDGVRGNSQETISAFQCVPVIILLCRYIAAFI